ncbi:MAG: hypothetical protein ABFS86_00405 [Planctomycetota bacterium]
MPGVTDIDRLLATRPTDEETARAAVAPYRSLDAAARLEALASLLRDMDTLLDGRMPVRSPDDENFWRHWMDPSLGRPR